MIYQILFLGLSVVIAANILIVVIALTSVSRGEAGPTLFRLRSRLRRGRSPLPCLALSER